MDDLISRAEAIEAIELVDWYHQNSNKDMVHGANSDEHQAWYKAQDIYEALESLPPADRPRGEFDGMIFSTDKYMAFIDKKEIHIMRKDAHKVTIERTFNTEERANDEMDISKREAER